MICHVSSFGMFARNFDADRDGYFATTAREVRTLGWGVPLHGEQAYEIAARNRSALKAAKVALARWRDGQNETLHYQAD